MQMSAKNLVFLTALAMIAFAANSVLARLALLGEGADPYTFTAVRLISGAIFLSVILFFQSKPTEKETSTGVWNALALFAYALAFSLSYVSLGAGMGALLLFAAVQISIIIIGLVKGQRYSLFEWLGLGIALGGLVYLFFPGLEAPPLMGAGLMILAGIAWGFYTYLGKSAKSAVQMTTRSFQFAAIPCLIFFAAAPFADLPISLDMKLVVLGVASGAITSGLGYVIWYKVVPHLRVATVSTVQLSVPLIAAIGGLLFIGEDLTLRLLIASALILGGIFMTIWVKKPAQ